VIEDYTDVAEKKGKQAAPGETWTAVRLPKEAKEQLEEMARREDRSVSYVLRRLVLDTLDREREQTQ
jgi:predicted transcriptional regulator